MLDYITTEQISIYGLNHLFVITNIINIELGIIGSPMTSYILGLILVFPVAISVWLGLYAWRRRVVPGATLLAGSMLGSAILASCYALELTSPNLTAKFFWHGGYYLGAFININFLFQFSWWYTYRYHTPKRAIPAGIFSAGILTMAAYATNGFHHLFYPSVWLVTTDLFSVGQ